MKVSKVCIIFLFLCLSTPAFTQDTLVLSIKECEAIFLKENLLLIAEKLEISKAEAMVLQARLWPNPSVTIDEINLWASPKQLSVFGQEIPGIGNSQFGKNQQVAFSIEQIIQTAGKRKKLVALEQTNVEKSRQYFEELLRNLKYELRLQLLQLKYLQSKVNILQNQLGSVKQLTSTYQKQVELGNIPQGEYVRLKALDLEISKRILELNKDINEAQKEIKLLLRLPASTYLVLKDDPYLQHPEYIKQLSPGAVIDSAFANRPDLKLATLEHLYYNKLYEYEKAQRTPNITLKGGYDRGGNFMYNFVGFGVGLDLPLFNRNQGKIQYAAIGMEQSKLLIEQQQINISNNIMLAWQNLQSSLLFYENIDPGYEKTLDQLLKAYTKNLMNRNMSLIEYLDFLDAYLENKKIILEAGKDLYEKVEELNYQAGKDLIY